MEPVALFSLGLTDEVGIYPPRLSAVRKHTPQSLHIIFGGEPPHLLMDPGHTTSPTLSNN